MLALRVWAWLRARPILLVPLLLGLAALGGYAAGRWAAPSKIITKTEERVVVQERVVTKVVHIRARDATRRTETTVTPTPSGPVTHTVTEVVTRERAAESMGTEANRAERASSSSTVTKVTDYPRLTLGVLAGVALAPGSVTPAYGGRVDYRIAGPFSVGAWGVYTGSPGKPAGAGGVALGFTF